MVSVGPPHQGGSVLGENGFSSLSLLLQTFGCGSVAQMLLSRGSHGAFLTVNLAFGFAAMLGILFSGKVSDVQWDYGQGTLSVDGTNTTVGIFATYPSTHLSPLNGFFDQWNHYLAIKGPVKSTLWVELLFDGKERGLLLFTQGYTYTAVNPARDLGPRLFTALAGLVPLNTAAIVLHIAKGYWFMVPLLARFLGGGAGGVLFDVA
ncbi:unnamed protein product [Boreogadus saida]